MWLSKVRLDAKEMVRSSGRWPPVINQCVSIFYFMIITVKPNLKNRVSERAIFVVSKNCKVTKCPMRFNRAIVGRISGDETGLPPLASRWIAE